MTYPPVPADRLAEAERLVRTTLLTFKEIAQRSGMSATTVSRHARAKGWTRPERTPAGRGTDVAALAADCLLRLKEQLSALRRDHARRHPDALQATLRTVAETTRTLKELARVAASWTPPVAPAPGPLPHGEPDGEPDDERFAALCDDLARDFARWLERGGAQLLPRRPGEASGS